MSDVQHADADPKPSLANKLTGHLQSVFRWGNGRAAVEDVRLNPIATLEGLVLLAGLQQVETSTGQLSAAMPVSEGELAANLVPLALSRIGLEARWERAERPLDITSTSMPVLAPLASGGNVVLLGTSESGSVRVRDGIGECDLKIETLLPLLAGTLLVTGHLDPVNGATEAQQRDLVQRNPKLWLLGAYLAERKPISRMMVAALLLNLCAFAIPLYMRAIYDRVVPNLAIESLLALSIGVVIVLVFELLLKKLKTDFVERVGIRVGQAVQNRAMMALLRARENRFGKTVGALTTALRDVEQLSLLVPQAIVTVCIDLPFVIAFFFVIGAIGGLAVLGPILGAAALMIVGLVTNYAIKLSSRRASKLMQARSDLIAEVTDGWSTIKANQAEGLFQRRWDILSDHLSMSNRDVRHWHEIPAATSGLLVQLVTVLVVIISVLQIKAGVMTTGALIAIIMLTGRAMVPVSTAITTFARLYQSGMQFNALAKILQSEAERQVSDPVIAPGKLQGEFGLARISYTFENAGEPSLQDISLSVAKGEKIAVIGKSGSGKSTLLQLMGGLLPKQDGMLTVDGHAIDRFSLAQLRQNITYCAQDSVIFDTSLWQNVLLGMPEPDQEVVERAIRCSGLDSFVARTVEGYMRKAGPRGSSLSGGQRQAVLLARALMRDPAVLLLDEPTAALDVSSELAVIAGLREAAADKTMIIATHRLALLELVDRVIWLDAGRVVADRPKADVLAQLAGQNGKQSSQEAA